MSQDIKRLKEKYIILEMRAEGVYCVERAQLVKAMKEIWTDEQLAPLAEEAGIPLITLKKMPWIAFLKIDIANKDIMGWRQHRKVLKDEGFDVGEDIIEG